MDLRRSERPGDKEPSAGNAAVRGELPAVISVPAVFAVPGGWPLA
jgi:hypothetical protein